MKGIDAIRAAREMAGIRSDRELMRICGIPESTFYHLKDTGELRLWQLKAIIEATDMPDNLILEVVK
jgi:hypothetical protein